MSRNHNVVFAAAIFAIGLCCSMLLQRPSQRPNRLTSANNEPVSVPQLVLPSSLNEHERSLLDAPVPQLVPLNPNEHQTIRKVAGGSAVVVDPALETAGGADDPFDLYRSRRSECTAGWRLPPGHTRFCRASDGAHLGIASRLTRVDLPERDSLVCDSASPAAVVNCSETRCGHASGCLIAAVSPNCQHRMLLFQARNASSGWGLRGTITVLPDLTSDSQVRSGFYGTIPVAYIDQCADIVMRGYCTHQFQVLLAQSPCGPEGACGVRCLVFNGGPHSANVTAPLFTFVHRSEWRWSLLRDDLRLAIPRGLPRPLRVPRDGRVALPDVVVSVRRRMGELVVPGLTVDVTALLFVSHCTRDGADSNAQNHSVLLHRARQRWVSPDEDSPDAVVVGRGHITFKLPQVAQMAKWVGCVLTLRFVGVPHRRATSQSSPEDFAPLPPFIRKDSRAIVHYEATAITLRAEFLRTRRTSCATHLRDNECCLEGFKAQQVRDARDTTQAAGDTTYVASASRYGASRVYLNLTNLSASCISIVDGHYTSFDPGTAVAAFPWLVMSNRCSNLTSYDRHNGGVVEFTLHKEGDSVNALARTIVPLAVFAPCFRATQPDVDDRQAQQTLQHRQHKPMSTQPIVVLVSILIHDTSVIEGQLRNIAVFVPGSVIVLHLAPSGRFNETLLLSLNGTAHPYVLFNPVRDWDSRDKVAQVSLSSARYVAEHHPWVSWTHTMQFASNEMFVRAGLVEHIRDNQIDLTSISYPIGKYKKPVLASRRFYDDPDVRVRAVNYWRNSRAEGSVSGEFGLGSLMRLLGLKAYATKQIFNEGMIFNRSIAVRLSRVLDAVFNATVGDCMDTWFVHSEAFVLQLLHNSCGEQGTSVTSAASRAALLATHAQDLPANLDIHEAWRLMDEVADARCGDRVSMVLWNNANYGATQRDIDSARCSPFTSPLAFKRFPRSPDDPMRAYLKEIERDIVRAQALRDDEVTCTIVQQQ